MKKDIHLILLSVLTILLTFNATYSQSGLSKSNKEFEDWGYLESAKIFEKVLKRGYESQDLLQKLADAYYYNSKYHQANKHYKSLFEKYSNEEIQPEYYYRYSQTLLHVGEEVLSRKYYDEFVKKVGKDSQIVNVRFNESELKQQNIANSGRYKNFENLAINTIFSDYGSFLKDDVLYFTSARDTGNLSKEIHTWTDAPFTRIFKYMLNDEPIRKNISAVKDDVVSKLNESTAVITKDGKTMYFTRNNIKDNQRRYDSNKNTKLKIYQASLINGKWTNIEELPFNGDEFNTAHPVLSSDEKLLYFASDRPGGYGSSDIWRIARHENGTFGGPENVGPSINTEARETFPFITKDNELYFSSDGRVGLGGLDVYAVQTYIDGSFGSVQNVGEPINSNADDFSYYIDKLTKQGFVSSNRSGGKGNDDIYKFTEDKSLVLECLQSIEVEVRDKNTNTILSDVDLSMYDFVYQPIDINVIKNNDAYGLGSQFRCGKTYRVKASKTGYLTNEIELSLNNKSTITTTIYLESEKVVVKKGDDLFKVLNLNPIYFDLNKHEIRKDAALELSKILAVLEEHPEMHLDIRSHTDSRASHKYNDELSERRAQATLQWFVNQGVSAKRLTAKGYGERELINDCSDGIECSEEEHQQNRRSEFIIVNM